MYFMVKEMELEELIAQTEQKILDKEYYEDVDVEYKGGIIHTRIRPVSQSKIVSLTRNKKALETAEFNTLLIHECVLNKHNNEPFTIKQINELFTGGLAAALTVKCLEVSGISLNNTELQQLQDF